MVRAYLGTQSGVYRLEGERLIPLGLDGQTCMAIHAFSAPAAIGPDHDTVLAGSYAQGIFRSTDGGATWMPANTGLTTTVLRTITADAARAGAMLCGTEPGRGFR